MPSEKYSACCTLSSGGALGTGRGVDALVEVPAPVYAVPADNCENARLEVDPPVVVVPAPAELSAVIDDTLGTAGCNAFRASMPPVGREGPKG